MAERDPGRLSEVESGRLSSQLSSRFFPEGVEARFLSK